MSKLEFTIRIITLVLSFSLIVFVIWADKPVAIVASMISIIVAALSGDWTRLNGGTTIINEDDGNED
jgi:hypothetical protein